MSEVTQTWYVWLVAAKHEFAEALVARLVRRGFTVGPLGRQLISRYDEGPDCVVAFSMKRDPRDDAERKAYTPSGIYTEVRDVLKLVDAKYWGIVISESAACTWCTGNSSINSEIEQRDSERRKGMN